MQMFTIGTGYAKLKYCVGHSAHPPAFLARVDLSQCMRISHKMFLTFKLLENIEKEIRSCRSLHMPFQTTLSTFHPPDLNLTFFWAYKIQNPRTTPS